MQKIQCKKKKKNQPWTMQPFNEIHKNAFRYYSMNVMLTPVPWLHRVSSHFVTAGHSQLRLNVWSTLYKQFLKARDDDIAPSKKVQNIICWHRS